jgi:hypothetical protein
MACDMFALLNQISLCTLNVRFISVNCDFFFKPFFLIGKLYMHVVGLQPTTFPTPFHAGRKFRFS